MEQARVDMAGRLLHADPLLLGLQEQAGASLGDRLVLPQLAAIARLAFRLGIPVARQAVVAGHDQDIEMWLHAEPEDEVVILTVERWHKKAASGPRLEMAERNDEFVAPRRGEWAADADLLITDLAPDLAQTLGAASAAAVGEPLTKWLRMVENIDGGMPILLAVASRSEFSGQHAVARHGNGAKLILSGRPIFDADDEFRGFRGTAFAEVVQHPLAANEEAGAGIDPAIDDALRSPIDRIISAAEGIASRSEGPLRQDYAVYAGDIAAAARHLASVIRSMADQSNVPASTVDAVALADEAIGLVETHADEKGVLLARDGIHALQALGEQRAIIQILVNLLGNAVRHAPQGSTVSVSLNSGTEFASWTVCDEGSGIAPEDQERIFGRFERGTEGGGSSGLGLAIARRLARSMGGDITLVSTPGDGARFTLSLPLAP